MGTDHLLLGLLRETRGIAVQVLNHLGFTLETARDELKTLLGVGDGQHRDEMVGLPAREKIEWTLGERINLNLGGTDVTITLAGTRHCRVTVGDSGIPIPDLRISGGIVACLVTSRLSGGHINVARLIELLQALPIYLQH